MTDYKAHRADVLILRLADQLAGLLTEFRDQTGLEVDSIDPQFSYKTGDAARTVGVAVSARGFAQTSPADE